MKLEQQPDSFELVLPTDEKFLDYLKNSLTYTLHRQGSIAHRFADQDVHHKAELSRIKGHILDELIRKGVINKQNFKEQLLKDCAHNEYVLADTKLYFDEAFDEMEGVINKTNPEGLSKKIKIVKNFNSLYKELESVDGIWGSQDFFTSEKLINMINGLRNGQSDDINYVTGGAGLRDKVEELLKKEKKSKN